MKKKRKKTADDAEEDEGEDDDNVECAILFDGKTIELRVLTKPSPV